MLFILKDRYGLEAEICLYDMVMEVTTMDTKNIILKLRTEGGMSQDELADEIIVKRQVV